MKRIVYLALTLLSGCSESGAGSTEDGGLLDVQAEAGQTCTAQTVQEGATASAISSMLVCPGGDGKLRGYHRADLEGDVLCPTGEAPTGSACSSNSQCASGELCACPLTYGGNRSIHIVPGCIPAQCTGPADCNGEACGVSVNGLGEVNGAYCRHSQDACGSDLDCQAGQYCGYVDSQWGCIDGLAG